MNSKYTIAVIGLWHLGEVYAASLAKLGHKVIGLSEDQNLIANFKNNIPPLKEPELEGMLQELQANRTLSFSDDFKRASEADVVWFTFDTPVDDQDEVDVSIIFSHLEKVIPHLKDGVVVAVSSQLPVGTSREIKEKIRSARPEITSGYFYSPENLRLGEAVKCFLEPGRVVVGSDDDYSKKIAEEIFAPLQTEIVHMSSPSGEMAKHALNAFLATCISFTNDLADVSERVGADIEEVIKALKTDPRVGPKAYLFAGLGFSGGTLGRDLKALMGFAKRTGMSLPMIASAYEKNQSRNSIVQSRLLSALGSVKGKRLALFGITYKPGTPTLRRSQPLEIEAELRGVGAVCSLYDPLAISEEVKEKTPSDFSNDAYKAAKEADAIIVLNPNRDFQNLDFKKLAEGMAGKIFFDTANVLISKESEIRSAGFNYLSIGRS